VWAIFGTSSTPARHATPRSRWPIYFCFLQAGAASFGQPRSFDANKCLAFEDWEEASSSVLVRSARACGPVDSGGIMGVDRIARALQAAA
jgi:hypothetical protein